VRQQLVKSRASLVNQARGLLAEFGIVVAQGVSRLRRALPTSSRIGKTDSAELMRELLGKISERLQFIDDRLSKYDSTIQEIIPPAFCDLCPWKKCATPM
jgi:transposase